MLRSYLATALANLARNWLYAGITILGLAAGFAAAILIGLYVRDEYSFDRFIPGWQDAYRLEMDLVLPGQKPLRVNSSVSTAAANLALDFRDVQAVARLQPAPQTLGRSQANSVDGVAWVDPDFFRVLPYPVLAGDPAAALHAPDGLVLTRQMARKYFGQDAPIGKVLLVGSASDQPLPPGEAPLFAAPHAMRVLAVLKDIPNQTHLKGLEIFGSGSAAWSALALGDRHPTAVSLSVLTYVRLPPGVSPDRIRAGLAAFARRHYVDPTRKVAALQPRLERLADLHFYGNDHAIDAGVATVGALIILIAAINFITLMTARASRRAVEVGIRKVAGARRIDLVVQFMGEALVQVLAATLIAVALVELTLPFVNAFLQRTITFDYLHDPALFLAIAGGALLTALLAGLYPAVVLSSFQPALALKGAAGQSAGSVGVRQALVVVQFGILIGLMVMAGTIYRQTSFALDDALRLHTDQLLQIVTKCDPAFKQELAALPGIRGVACGSRNAYGTSFAKTFVAQPGRAVATLETAPIDVGFLEMHGLKPIAGRFFSRDQGEDVVLDRPGAGPDVQPSIVINETAVRELGFGAPQNALGKTISWGRWSSLTAPGPLPSPRPSQIVGVVRDFTLNSIRTPIDPTIYFVDPIADQIIVARFDGRRLPETLVAIDRLWRNTGHDRPIVRGFESQWVQQLYRDVTIQGVVIAVCSGLAILIACLGLFALAAFTTERRTKEIGVRKAMGASTFDVVRLLVWQFTQPVLWANLIAWPLAWWAMRRWLDGFAYRVDLPAWLFLAAAAAAVAIAWLTVSVHSWLVARARPVLALRYE
jgi:putative ABC transport system permease protein